ncbi:hypothetical protein A1A1_16660 [Planococcus antarcticus DSM 14505]|uniref:Lipoprotein n=1 Tax=Planococcus antarcticus DSM 14505 TaxID=1185653 RepID=A0AA87IJ41_9BACL|nr:hypothetical protein [Planococcus antarcticus]EIM05372.1 hypothetical protein A1A1_16660 [Planococcus antarcticus DSM 14505]
MKYEVLLLTISILFLTAACLEERVIDSENTPQVKEITKDIFETPPELKIVVDGVEIAAVLGARTWSYFDEKEKAMTLFEAETHSPLEIAEHRKASKVNETTKIGLEFERDPHSYNFYRWDSGSQRIGPFSEITFEESKGKTVYEVVATWDQGTAHYVFSLEVE